MTSSWFESRSISLNSGFLLAFQKHPVTLFWVCFFVMDPFFGFYFFWHWCLSPLPPGCSAVWLFPNIAVVFSRVNSAITPGRFQSPSCGQVQFHLFLTCVSYFRDHSALLYISVKLCFTKTLTLLHCPSSCCQAPQSLIFIYIYVASITD